MFSRQWHFRCHTCEASLFIHPRRGIHGHMAQIAFVSAREEARRLGWHSGQCELCVEVAA